MSDNKKLNHNYVNSNGISQEHIFYKKYLIYKLKYKKLLKQLEVKNLILFINLTFQMLMIYLVVFILLLIFHILI